MAKVFISTAEISAERHASHLVEALLRHDPALQVDVAGGAVLARSGARLAVDTSGRGVIGFLEAIKQLGFYRHAAKEILSTLAKGYDALVLVDAPSFHLPIAKIARKRWPDLPILYYIAPKLWAWKEWRIKNLRRDITRTMCIFPFEQEYFRSRGVDAVYVGNPTLDQLRDVTGSHMTRVLKVDEINRHGEPDRGVLAVFPGSRRGEIRHIWPRMAKAIELLRADFSQLKVVVSLAPGFGPDKLANHAPIPDGVEFVHADSQELLAAASVVLAKSGTSTLEAALLGKPMVVCYAGDSFSYHIAKRFVKLSHISLPNILAGKTVVTELIQHQATPENMAAEIRRLLTDRRF
ncbi:MAG: lipid-A-disaccharide synthase [Planctomycetes bacterium]|nr:lipid-A-disaccharide synthase [Planctomycetota bacterium]